MNNKNVLKSLTSIALTLPGVGAMADQIATETSINLRHYQYGEDPMPAKSTSINEEVERYDIDTNYLKIVTPVKSDMDFSFTYQAETMTGASPWFLTGSVDQAKQTMTGASIKEERDFLSATTRLQRGLHQVGVTLSRSTENDYDSNTLGLSYQKDNDDKSTTYSLGIEYSGDDINAIQQTGAIRPRGKTKNTRTLFFDYSWIINRNSVAKVAFGYTDISGYISDPYKMVLVPGVGLVNDSRPDNKKQKNASFKYRHFLPELNSALHFNALYYKDDWNVASYTLETAWYFNLSDQLQIAPSYRYYAQSDSFFYRNIYEEARDDGYYSTDYRLSSFGATTIGLAATYRLDQFAFSLSYERYKSDVDKGLDNDEPANVGLVDFDVLGIGLDYVF